jgi:hypothetical protein
LAIDEDWEEVWESDFESEKREDPLKDCEEDLEKLEYAVYEFIERLKHVTMNLNSDGQLRGEGLTRIMNLIAEYWHKAPKPEDQE